MRTEDSRERRRTLSCPVRVSAELEPERTSLSSKEKRLLFSLEDNLELEVLEWRLASGEADHKEGEFRNYRN